MKNNIFRFRIFLLLQLFVLALVAQIPVGYYNAATGTGATLKTQLYTIIHTHTARTYDNLWTDFQTTDQKPNSTVWDIYTDIPSGTPVYSFTFGTQQCGSSGYTNEGDCYNREHSFPKSWFADATPMYTDLFHLYPTDGKVNGMRSNYPYGVVGTASYTSSNGCKLGNCVYPGYSGTVFEPIDEYKGDLARTYFYMATCYENLIGGWKNNDANGSTILSGNAYPAYETWFLNMLGEWSAADPVSQKEIDRNNAIYGIQGNRNPYIDHPEYIYSVWGVGNLASSTPEPTNYPTNLSAKNIKIQWVDASGATIPEHYLIRMSATGFNNISTPVDGISYANSSTDKNVDAGVHQVWFTNLNANTIYYFKIFGYTGSGASSDYKTDGVVPQSSVKVP
ncbi:MAG: endonuclease [Bacteroidales bacterium]|nr:endonuclease [Bacteroidales bacterium]